MHTLATQPRLVQPCARCRARQNRYPQAILRPASWGKVRTLSRAAAQGRGKARQMAQDSAKSAQAPCDPVTLQIVRGALRAIQGEMEAVIERTAMSPFIREKKDFYAALFDGSG